MHAAFELPSLCWITLLLAFVMLGLVTLVAVVGHTHSVLLYGSLMGYTCRHWAIGVIDGL